MSTVLNFQRRVRHTVEQSDALGVSDDDLRFISHNRPAPPHTGIYCLQCGNALRPDTHECPECGAPNPVRLLTSV